MMTKSAHIKNDNETLMAKSWIRLRDQFCWMRCTIEQKWVWGGTFMVVEGLAAHVKGAGNCQNAILHFRINREDTKHSLYISPGNYDSYVYFDS